MRPLVLHDLLAAILYVASLATWSLVELTMRLRSRSRSRPHTAPEWTFLFVILMILASAVAATVADILHLAPLPGPAWWPMVVGLGLLWAGILLRLWAVLTLGRFFKLTVVIQEGHRVIDHGPYRWLRHPSYLGVIFAAGGIGLIGGDWVGAAALLVGTVTAFSVRIPAEERALLQALGEEYAAYARRTARLVPGLL